LHFNILNPIILSPENVSTPSIDSKAVEDSKCESGREMIELSVKLCNEIFENVTDNAEAWSYGYLAAEH
jgi:hypothetical protein